MKQLLFSITKKDFNIQHFGAGGKGGQNQNKRAMGARVVHKLSGATGEGRDQRSQLQNTKSAFKRCIDSKKFKAWLKIAIAHQSKDVEDINKVVDNMLKPENLKVEYGVSAR